MTSRPTARAKSALAGASPIAENVQTAGERKVYPKKDAFYPDAQIVNRAKNAQVALKGTLEFEEWTWSDMVNRALDVYTRSLEERYNDAEQFPQRPEGSVGPGRPRSSAPAVRPRRARAQKNDD